VANDVLSSYSDAGLGIESVSMLPATVNCSNLGPKTIIVTVKDNCNNQTEVSAQITVLEGTALLAPWASALIGNSYGTAQYSACTAPGRFTLTARGYSSPNADVQEFVYQPLTGNGSIVVRVLDITGGGWAGVQIRESSAPGAKKVLLKTQFQTMIRSEVRQSTGGAHSTSQILRQGIKWMKLVRTGNRFDGFTSVDGIGWRSAFSTTVTMAAPVQVGILTESINNVVTTQARFDNVVVTPGSAKSVEDKTISAKTNTLDTEVEVYPNPASNYVNIEIPEYNGKVQLTVYSAGSKMLHSELITQSLTQLDVSYLKPGIYFLRFDLDGTLLTKRLVVY
jgi:hypothetical protein